jgi:hypothetical protein
MLLASFFVSPKVFTDYSKCGALHPSLERLKNGEIYFSLMMDDDDDDEEEENRLRSSRRVAIILHLF